MAQAVLSWLLAIPLLGFVTGMRSMTPMAVLCWFAYGGRLSLDGTWASWAGRLSVAILFTILAIAEYVGDKQRWIPDRTGSAPLVARLFFGGLMGAIVVIALDGSSLEGGLLGVFGALTGTFCGYHFRKEIVRRMECRDWQVAVGEDVLAVGCAVIAMGIVTS